ncbi:unnamed protein product [Ectocarpus sp. 12 AP-2014]
MHVALDQLESLWPPYRGAVLLGAARESQGRACNTGVAVTAGHVALSLDVNPASSDAAATTRAAAGSTNTEGNHHTGDGALSSANEETTSVGADTYASALADPVGPSPPPLRLTVLLDAVPATAPTPGTHQMARFLTKVLARKAPLGADGASAGSARKGERLLGEDVPEMLVVEHLDEVVCSEFVRCDNRSGPSATKHGGDGSTKSNSKGRNNGLVYACIEASGLLRLWEWGGDASGLWSWRYLNSCNICACREDPIGCRVLTAAIVPDPVDGEGNGSSNRRNRLVWEQEDSGEGAGLGLASTPSTDPRSSRRVWSRRVSFDLAEGSISGGNLGSAHQQQQQYATEEGSGAGFGSGSASNRTVGSRSEISLAFSACLLPKGVDELLCSRLGVWMPTGPRVYLNHFPTGRLHCFVLPGPSDSGTGGSDACAIAREGGGLDNRHDAHRGGGADGRGTFTESGSGPGFGESAPREGGGRGATSSDDEATAEEIAEKASSPASSPRCLLAVHEPTGDLMLYDHHPCATVRVLSLPPGSGGLKLHVQCTLDIPPVLGSPPHSFSVRSNVAVFCGSGVCSMYDLCTGYFLGKADIPRCSACAARRRHRSKTCGAVSLSPALSCSCGRRQGLSATELLDGRLAASTSPRLWASETRGHLTGILTATQVLRFKLPRMEECLRSIFGPSRRGNSPPPPAPRILRYLREYKRLLDGSASDSWPMSLLPVLLRLVQQDNSGDATPTSSQATLGAQMLSLMGHTLAGEERGRSDMAAVVETAAANNPRGAPVPPWLFLAMVSAAQNRGRERGFPCTAEAGGIHGTPRSGGGDPATAATEEGLRTSLERRVSESLRSLSSVRALLQAPVSSARQHVGDGRIGALRSAADDEAAIKLAALTADVDPATALFEGTLREWLASRRRGKGEGVSFKGAPRPAEGSVLRGEQRPSGIGLGHVEVADAGESGTVLDDAMALAFRCEAADDKEATEIPFLRSLLEGLGGAQDPGQSRGGLGGAAGGGNGPAKYGDNGAVKASPSPASSTFLCLQLVGDDQSPLFEVACRALFRLLPRELPRFVERLARFRSYADEIKRRGARETEAALQDVSSDEEGEGEEGDRQPPLLRRGRQRTSWSSGDAKSEATLRGDGGGGGDEHGDSTVSGSDEHHQHRPTSPMWRTGTASRRQSEDNASDSGGRVGRPPTRASSRAGTSRERSPEQAAPVPASPNPSYSCAADDSTHPVTAPADAAASHHQPPGEERSHGTPPVSTAYFSRALACLPPAVEDDRGDGAGCQRRRARLSLLLGARKFTEACRLLRHRAWGCFGGAGTGAFTGSSGKRGSWRGDRGAAEAWGANMRLLNELDRAAAAAATIDKADDAAAAAAVAARGSVGDATASLSPAAAAETAGNGSVALQFRLAFEDTLAETILEDSPERMKEVMICRPSGLTPVRVVRMVRRAAEAGVASPTGDGGVGDGGDDSEANQPPRCGSTQTLKMCLLLLLEDDTRLGVGGV